VLIIILVIFVVFVLGGCEMKCPSGETYTTSSSIDDDYDDEGMEDEEDYDIDEGGYMYTGKIIY
jgi:hypothetical protein